MSLKKKLAIASAVVLALAGATCGVGYHYYKEYIDINTFYSGISVEGIDLSGNTLEEGKKKLEDHVAKLTEQKFTLTFGDKTKDLTFEEIGFQSKGLDTIVDNAYATGREGTIIDRVKTVYNLTKEPVNYDITYQVDDKKVEEIIEKKTKKWNSKVKDATISRKDGKFKVTKDVSGVVVHADKTANAIFDVIKQEAWSEKPIPIEVVCDVTPAQHTKKELDTIKDVLGTYKTTYYDSNWGRCKNVENGASKINGTLLYPGDSFSVHDAVTPFNKENGYELAGSYNDGQVVQTYGGGICQVSTTLYNAVLRAELEVKERHPHSMTVHYVPLSADAAIAGTEKDFKFVNNLDTPIYIEGKAGDRVITFTIYGQEYRSKDREVSFESETLATYNPKIEYKKDNTLEKGKKNVIAQKGVTGYKARLWKIVKEKGEDTERTVVNTSEYRSVKQIELVGTKEKKKANKKKADTSKTTNKTPAQTPATTPAASN